MKNAFLAMIVLAMAAVGCGSSNSNDKPDTGTTGAGGGQPAGDPMSQACDKAESCQVLTTLMPTITSAAQCKQVASASLSAAPAEFLPQINQKLNDCLQQPDCAAFTACMKPLLAIATAAPTP